MSAQLLEERVAALEEEMARLKDEIKGGISTSCPPTGWSRIVGTFANEPLYEDAIRLGADYRKAQRENEVSDADDSASYGPLDLDSIAASEIPLA